MREARVQQTVNGKWRSASCALLTFALSLFALHARGQAASRPTPGRLTAQNNSSATVTPAQTVAQNNSIEPTRNSLQTRLRALRDGSKLVYRFRMGLVFENFGNELDRAQNTVGVLGINLAYRPIKVFEFRMNADVNVGAGYSQTQFGEFQAPRGILLREVLVRFKPIEAVSLSAGAIDQKHLQAPLLVNARPFLGAVERVEFGPDEFKVSLVAQQTIPTALNLTSRAVESEPTPSFLSEVLTFSTKPIPNVEASAYGGHWGFRNLPSAIAFDSSAFGNTVSDVAQTTSQFTYQFDGWMAGGTSRIQVVDSLAWKLHGQMLQNTRAPDGYRNGQMVQSSFEITLPGNVVLEPSGIVFFAESDLAPGVYSSDELGHANRQGWGAGLESNFKEYGFKIGGRFVDADVINASPIQSRQQYFKINFETFL